MSATSPSCGQAGPEPVKALAAVLPTLLLTVLLAPQSFAQEPVLTDQEKLARSVEEVQQIGDALMSWLIDIVPGRPSKSGLQPLKASWTIKKAADEKVLLFTQVSYEDVARILTTPLKYLEEVPEKNPWGHPYKFAFNDDVLRAENIICVVSPGKDGRFERSPYVLGSFDEEDYNRDVVWADGEMIRWPAFAADENEEQPQQ